ncbi:MAG: hypothetical protein KBI32_01185 [Phycisphaerae bacterium]|nr:hypothetical protein [Phycisphaerae bacterium]HON91105.1 hypothetical protein [Sedimentisphaerales bacterium]
MFKRLKPGKIAIVVFLTALIWVWSDLSQDDRFLLSDVRIKVAKSADPSLWVNFVVEGADPNLQTTAALDSVVLKGPAARISEVKGRKNRGALDLNLFLVPEQEGLTSPQAHRVNVLDFLRKSDVFRNLGLTVESCQPQWFTVQTQKLVEQDVTLECVGIEQGLVATFNPSSVTAYVPKGQSPRAKILLTPEEQNVAKIGPVEKFPYIELASSIDQRREIPTKVKVTLAPMQNVLTERLVSASYGLCLSENLQGVYRVVLDKDTDKTRLLAIKVRATEEAFNAYEKAPMQIVLYIKDEDAHRTQWPAEGEFVFAFPYEYVRRGEIVPNQAPPKVKYTLEPITFSPTPELDLFRDLGRDELQ